MTHKFTAEELGSVGCIQTTGSSNCIVRLNKECCPGITDGKCKSMNMGESSDDVHFPWNFLWKSNQQSGKSFSEIEELRLLNKRILHDMDEMERAAGLPQQKEKHPP